MIERNLNCTARARTPTIHSSRWTTALVVVCALLSQTSIAASAPEVRVHEGTLQGQTVDGNISEFLGIPFASPPIGPLRWKLPQPAASWSGVRPAIAYSPACTQDRSGYGGLFAKSQSEDCLYLNLWSPDLKPSKPLPVMVYIHGGAFTGGAGTIPGFDGAALGKHGVIVVTINYRLGIFGFFAHADLTGESPHKVSGNYGLADQLAALRWVKQNVSAFGGDPSRVTVFGQSAGSVSTLDLMASPLSRGLIQGAIAESGTPLLGPGGTSLADAEKEGDLFARAQIASITQLRSLPADELLAKWTKFAAGGAHTWPIVDGWILPKAAATVFADHKELPIPLLTGSNAREALSVPSESDLTRRLRDVFGDATERATSFYPKSARADSTLGSDANLFATDITFRCPAVVIETWHAQKGVPVYAYQFEQTLPGREAAGSQHSDEVGFVFGTLDMMKMMWGGAPLPGPTAKLSESMVAYWANFAKNGDPNGPGLPRWPRFTPNDGTYVHLNGEGISADTKLRDGLCEIYRVEALPRLLARNALP